MTRVSVERQRLDGGRDGARSTWSRRSWPKSTATSSPPTSTAAAQCVIGGASRGGASRPSTASSAKGFQARAPPGEPRLPHADRGAGQRAAAAGARPAATFALPQLAGRHQRHRRLLPDRSVEAIKDLLERQIASPCSGSRGSRRSTPRACAPSSRSGPRRRSRASSTTCSASKTDVVSLFTNHPRPGELQSVQPGAVRPVRRRLWRARSRRVRHNGATTVAPASPSPLRRTHRRRSDAGRTLPARP